jgi:hypothetical protein
MVNAPFRRYPWIVEAALKKRHKQFILEGEAVILGVDGTSDSDALHSGSTMTRCSAYEDRHWVMPPCRAAYGR